MSAQLYVRAGAAGTENFVVNYFYVLLFYVVFICIILDQLFKMDLIYYFSLIVRYVKGTLSGFHGLIK